MRIVAVVLLFMLIYSCHSTVEPFKITRFKQYPGGGLDRGGCNFIDQVSKAEIFITYDTCGYLSIDDSVVVLRSMPLRADSIEHYESGQFEVDVTTTLLSDSVYKNCDYSGVVTIKKKGGGSVTKKVFAVCGL